MKIELDGDALQLLDDFLKYGQTMRDEVADAVYYDYDGFSRSLKMLQKAYDAANK